MLVSNGVSVNTIPDIASTLLPRHFAKTSSCRQLYPCISSAKASREGEVEFSSSNEEGYNSPLTSANFAPPCIVRVTQQQDQTGYTLYYVTTSVRKFYPSLLSLFNRIWGNPRVSHTVVSCPRFYRFQSLAKIQHQQLITALLPHKLLKQADGAHGLIFDQSLRFHRHLKDLKIRSANALNILKVLANTHWGADRTSLLRLYRALIRSKLDYGSVVYSSACKSLLKILDPVHHQA
ncbi:putative RNA-directed DNA polymerase from transposon X-element [Trichonephila clavipes]|nr:putative RNA-directed DNA polymerase from transposon X-element [Trichonephila clavipes]